MNSRPHCGHPRKYDEGSTVALHSGTQVALTNSLLQYVLTCMVEPPEDVLPAARAHAKARYAKILRLAGQEVATRNKATLNLLKALAIYKEIGIVGHRFSLCGSLRAAPGVAAPGARLPSSGKPAKLTNPHFASRELRANLQTSTHRLEGFAQCANKDVERLSILDTPV